jgi:hypothetical protein
MRNETLHHDIQREMSEKPRAELVTIIGVLLGKANLTTTQTFQLMAARRILEDRLQDLDGVVKAETLADKVVSA